MTKMKVMKGFFFFDEKVMKGVVLDIYPDNRIFFPPIIDRYTAMLISLCYFLDK